MTKAKAKAKKVRKMYFYHPQTKFAKVMFSQVSVCQQGRGHAWQGV